MSGKFLSKLLEAFADHREQREIIYEGDSHFHHITIREESGKRTMYFGPCGEEAETSIDMVNPDQAVFEYPGMMLAALPLQPEGRRVLMLGLGGGFLPRLFQRHLPQYELTVVEVDVLVAELAQTYFGFESGGNVNLVIGDGREYIEKMEPSSVDQIWLDAFSGDYVPPQLTGLEFLTLCKSRLTPGGLVVQNLHQSRPRIFHNQLKTAEAAFESVLSLEGQRCGNAIIIGRKPGGPPGPGWKPADLLKAAKSFGPRLGPYDLTVEMRKYKKFTPNAGAVILE